MNPFLFIVLALAAAEAEPSAPDPNPSHYPRVVHKPTGEVCIQSLDANGRMEEVCRMQEENWSPAVGRTPPAVPRRAKDTCPAPGGAGGREDDGCRAGEERRFGPDNKTVEDGPLDPSTARALSAAGIVVPMGLFMVGLMLSGNDAVASGTAAAFVLSGVGLLLITPSAGHWYAGRYLTPGLIARLAGAGALVVGFVLEAPRCAFVSHCEPGVGGALMLAGVGAVGIGIGYDAMTSADAVRAYNFKVGVRPAVTRTPTGDLEPRLVLSFAY
jgi:hypothetical protein